MNVCRTIQAVFEGMDVIQEAEDEGEVRGPGKYEYVRSAQKSEVGLLDHQPREESYF